MITKRLFVFSLTLATMAGCATSSQQGTLAELRNVAPDLEEVYLEDSLERAAESYKRYLDETAEGAKTPEAMRRLADLQIEQEFGVIASVKPVEMAAPEMSGPADRDVSTPQQASQLAANEPTESERQFQERATKQEVLVAAPAEFELRARNPLQEKPD